MRREEFRKSCNIDASDSSRPGWLMAMPPELKRTPAPSLGLILSLRVCIPSSEVIERWITDDRALPEPVRKKCSAGDLVVLDSQALHLPQTVEYYVPQTVLERCATEGHFPCLTLDLQPRAYHCSVLSHMTRLALPYLQFPTMFASAFMEHFKLILCAQVAHNHGTGLLHSSTGRGGLSGWQRRTVMEFMTERRFSDFTVSQLAQHCQVSASHFARSFRVSFGQPVHTWVLNQRISRAKLLLMTSDHPLIEIAFQAGFLDQTTFNRTFSKFEGLSPGRWKRVHRVQQSVPQQPLVARD